MAATVGKADAADGQHRLADGIQGGDNGFFPGLDLQAGVGGKPFGATNITVAAHIHHRFLVGVYPHPEGLQLAGFIHRLPRYRRCRIAPVHRKERPGASIMIG
ncbi:hypothetical protein [Microbulbifer rhizosphaerae]|uniref:Uncharacterized protein n=1 Tax=Microbulbifer rhizosphaerae TaxID=1562603 RepID=A0A7W4WCS5_9GAMM|nr:hypothetical protein [Microbulbifer rhizosphaerae]MBB3061820.1 hypothetical protein [Microbulbifer rhizosphaerae]